MCGRTAPVQGTEIEYFISIFNRARSFLPLVVYLKSAVPSVSISVLVQGTMDLCFLHRGGYTYTIYGLSVGLVADIVWMIYVRYAAGPAGRIGTVKMRT